MNQLYQLNKELTSIRKYIWGDGVSATLNGNSLINQGIEFDGFVSFREEKGLLLGKEVLPFEEIVNMDDSAIMLMDENWRDIYDLLYQKISARRIYVNSVWKKRTIPCIACGNEETISTLALFNPFLIERMFDGEDRPTMNMHCPRCGMYYSFYRPTDKEMGKLYHNYRDNEYQKMRQKYEPGYTVEYNKQLFEPSDGGRTRQSGIYHFILGEQEKEFHGNILDFGGDKGQFIPEEFNKMDKYVYEISGTETIEGVTMITDLAEVRKKKWDIVLCNMVMEHLSDIQGYFRTLVSLLEDSSLLYIEVPYEIYAINADVGIFHEHINFFREKTFYYLAENNGCRILKSEEKENEPNIGGIIRVLIQKK